MCTSSPHAGAIVRRDKHARRRASRRAYRRGLSASGVAGELAEEVEHALGALDRDVGELEQGALLAGEGADQEGGHALVTQRGDRLERLEVAEVVAGEEEAAGARSPRPGCGRPGPCPCRASGPRSPGGRARPPGRTRRPGRVSTGSRRSKAPAGSSSRRVWTATASPLSSTNASPASYRRSTPGSRPRNVERPCGGRGETIRRLVEDQRSKPYWPNRCSSLPALADGVADLVEAAEGQRLAGRAAGDHRDRGHHVRQLGQHLPGVGVDVRGLGVVHDRGQGPVEVEADDGLRGGADERGVPVFGLRGAELHGPNPTMPARPAGSPSRGEPGDAARRRRR